ncbi:MAG: 3-oxoacyl-ACP synthase [Polyangiaceae bacterium]|nr:3-oxoacyl-ACP synthase [Polyangiaceae bacterium]
MAGFRITGSGRYLPGRPYTNQDLGRIMDTSDEWVRQRTGIEQRHFCPEGQGASDLALEAAKLALADAGRQPADLDYILFNTMTPDHFFPGSGPLLGAALGCPGVPALDLRMQCAAMLFSLQVADGLFRSGAASTILIIGAEAQAGFMPWTNWAALEPGGPKPSVEEYERATRHRGYAVIFGDGAGALLLERTDEGPGLLSLDLHSDGRYLDQLYIPAGYRKRPYVSGEIVAREEHLPQMLGREVFKHAVTKLPTSVRKACSDAGVTLDQIDWFIAHQANDRINETIRERSGVPAEKVPSNIARYGNTSTATIPILVDEMRRDGRLKAGQLVCVLALGAGLNWGAAVLRI